jgi:hypothetical protein
VALGSAEHLQPHDKQKLGKLAAVLHGHWCVRYASTRRVSVKGIGKV